MRRWLAALSLACPAAAWAAPGCPQFEGSFALAGQPHVLDEVLLTLGAGRSDFAVGGLITIAAWSGKPLRMSFTPAQPDSRSAPANWVLNNPAGFRCEKGWLVMDRSAEKSRDGFDGRVAVRIAPAKDGGGVQVDIDIKRRESIRIFSYDSAKVDLPLPWSSTSTERLTWPGGDIVVWQGKPPPGFTSEPMPAPPIARVPRTAPESGEPDALAQARQLLRRTGLTLGEVTADGTATRAQVLATPATLAKLEDTLRAAGVTYQVPVSPVQTASAYFVEVVLPRTPGADSQPSRLWLEQEMTRFLPGAASVNRVEWQDGVWTAQLGLLNGLAVEDALQRLRSTSKAVADVRVQPGTERALSSSLRVVEVRLSLR
jgi:hypothetical protein